MKHKFKKWDVVIIGVPTSLYDAMKQPEKVVLEPTAAVVLSYSPKNGYELGPISSITGEEAGRCYMRMAEHVAAPNKEDVARMLKTYYEFLNECNDGK